MNWSPRVSLWGYTQKFITGCSLCRAHQPCPVSGVFCSLLSDVVLLQKISNGIPLPPAQVPPSPLHVKQKPGSPPGQGPQWVLCEAVPKPPCFRGAWGGWVPTAAVAACVLAGCRRAAGGLCRLRALFLCSCFVLQNLLGEKMPLQMMLVPKWTSR